MYRGFIYSSEHRLPLLDDEYGMNQRKFFQMSVYSAGLQNSVKKHAGEEADLQMWLGSWSSDWLAGVSISFPFG